jgi:beta-lactam-binding protein with PASTA domain
VWKSKKKATPTPTAEAKFTMPKVVGMNLQLAQDLLQSKGSYILDQEDFKGLNRFQINDSNWKVCKQSPAPGKSVPVSTVVTLYSVKLTEGC